MKTRLIFTLAACAASAALAQHVPAEDQLLAQALNLPELPPMPAPGELMPERVVKGAPYCADAVHETVQWLPDANGGAPNRIVRQQTTRLCRDGEGRTRQESERNNRKWVYLSDPVAGETWQLDPAAKTARSLRGSLRMGDSWFDSAAWRDYGERMREWSKGFTQRLQIGKTATPPVPPVPPVPPAPPAPALLAGGEREIHIVRLDGNDLPILPTPPMPPEPPAVALRALELAPRGAGVLSPLGSKDIDGVRANGERTTWTIEAGKVGNEKPIVIVREVWTAPDLMLTLRSRDFDPRSSEVNYRLQNLKRGEPDAALMRVPGDYTVRKPAPRASAATG